MNHGRRAANAIAGAVAVLVVGLTLGSPARADERVELSAASDDTVHLRSGGLYRGRVTEIVPGDHVTLTVAGPEHEQKRIAWAEVERVIVASTTLPPPPVAPAAAAPPPMNGPRALVHLEGSKHAVLFRHPAGTGDLVQACQAPCDLELPLGDSYRVSGSGIPTTAEFRLQASPGGRVDLVVDGPSWFGIVSGGLLTTAGGVTAYFGVLLTLAGAACEGCNGGDSVRNAGIGITVAGAAAIGLGLAIVFPSTRTDVSQESGGRAASSLPAPTRPSPRDAFVRTPVWAHVATTGEGRAAPATFPALFEQHF